MKKLSEIIKTDCYIDCGTEEMLRKTVMFIMNKIDDTSISKTFEYMEEETVIVSHNKHLYSKLPLSEYDIYKLDLPIHHISEIDLNN